MDEIIRCPLCGKEHSPEHGTYQHIYKRYKRLVPGYFQPRLSQEELYQLTSGMHAICVNRLSCRDRQPEGK